MLIIGAVFCDLLWANSLYALNATFAKVSEALSIANVSKGLKALGDST